MAAADVDALRDFTLVGVDAPGCGKSTTYYPEIPLGIADTVDVTFKLVAALHLRGITLIGQSFGGLTALQFACRHGHLVSRFMWRKGLRRKPQNGHR